MQLFDNMVRSDSGPARFCETKFQWLNRSARASSTVIRDFWESSFAMFPNVEKADLRYRFRSSDDRSHHSACFEMYWLRRLQARRFTVEIHPPAALGKSTHPDFLVSRNGEPFFYLECCVSAESDELRGAGARLDQFFDELNKVSSPNFFLHARIDETPTSSFSMVSLRSEIEAWLENLDAASTISEVTEHDGEFHDHQFTIQRGGGLIILRAVPKSSRSQGVAGVRTYGSSIEPAFMGDSSRPVLQALKHKAKRYGQLPRPLVIAIDCIDAFIDVEAAASALYGWVRNTDHGMQAYTVSDLPKECFWTRGEQPINTRVAGVLLSMNLFPWSVGSEEPLLWNNPWAQLPPGTLETLGCGAFCAQPSTQPADGVERPTVELTYARPTATPMEIFNLPAEWARIGRVGA